MPTDWLSHSPAGTTHVLPGPLHPSLTVSLPPSPTKYYQAHCVPVSLCTSPFMPSYHIYLSLTVRLCTTTRSTVWSVSQSHCVLRPTVWCYIPISLCTTAHHTPWQQGVEIAQWLEHQTSDWKVTGSSPCRSGDSYFSICSTTPVTIVLVANKRSFLVILQKYRWQVTAKHACTLHTQLCLKQHDWSWCLVVWMCTLNTPNSSSFMWHQPHYCQCCK